MNWALINSLLDALDTAANANAFWLELGTPKSTFDLEQLLLQHLRTGNFHFELVKQDIRREWNNYVEVIFPQNADLPVLLPKPGNTWNGTETISSQALAADEVEALLMDLLTGQKKYFTKSTAGSTLDWESASILVEEALEMLRLTDPDWRAYRIATNFLNEVDDYYDSGYIKLGYFEGRGRDLALAFLLDDSLYILLTNGYG